MCIFFLQLAIKAQKEGCEFEILDLKDYIENETIDDERLSRTLYDYQPNVLVLSMCFSQVSKVKVALERIGLLARIKLEKSIVSATNGRIVELDEDQRKLIATVVHTENIHKNVVISGPEGSGKTLLGLKLVKIIVSNYIHANNFSPSDGKDYVRVIVAACYGQSKVNQVELLRKQLEMAMGETLKPVCKIQFCKIEAQETRNSSEFNGCNNILLKLIKAIKNPGKYKKTVLMIDETGHVEFETKHWAIYEPLRSGAFRNVQVIFNLKFDFDDMKVRRRRDPDDETELEPADEAIKNHPNVVFARLRHSHRCSNEIRMFVYYLLIHSSVEDMLYKFKYFHHEKSAFQAENKPLCWTTRNVRTFVAQARSKQFPFDFTDSDVLLIYDPRNLRRNDPFETVREFCKKQKWDYYSENEIVGVEYSTVILYDLGEFHFEAFTRAVNRLVLIITDANV